MRLQVIQQIHYTTNTFEKEPTSHNNEVFPENYNIYRKDRIDQEGGDEVNDMHVDEKSEIIWAKIEIVGSKALYVSSFYNAKTSFSFLGAMLNSRKTMSWSDIPGRISVCGT
jgi:hypothetical protein